MRVAPLEKPRLGRHKPSSFPPNPTPKNAGTKHFMFGGRFGVSPTGADNGLRSTLADFFIKKRIALANRKKGFYTSRMSKNEDIRWIFV
jgi:hypothetical protein